MQLKVAHGVDCFNEISWIKFSNKPGSNGAYRLKALETRDPDTLEHGNKRREILRSMIPWINQAAARVLLPEPLSLDSKGNFEHRISRNLFLDEPSHLEETLITLWKHVPGEHFQCAKPPYVWTSYLYDPMAIREMAKTLFEVQKLGNQWLALQENRQEIEKRLTNEYIAVKPYHELVNSLFNALGISNFNPEEVAKHIQNPKSTLYQALRENANKKKQEIQKSLQSLLEELSYDPFLSLDEATEFFLSKQEPSWETFLAKNEQRPSWEVLLNQIDQTSSKSALLGQALFRAERENGWSPEVLVIGKRLFQLHLANEIVSDILENQSFSVQSLLKNLLELKSYYTMIEKFPEGICHNNMHPHQFLSRDGKGALLDVLGISYGTAFADLANGFVYSFTANYTNGKIPREKAIEYLQATLLPEWIQDYGPDLLAYNVVSFWNFAQDVLRALSLQKDDAENLNLAFTLEIFLLELEKRKKVEEIYRNDLFPETR